MFNIERQVKITKDNKTPKIFILTCVIETIFIIVNVIGMILVHSNFSNTLMEADAGSGWYLIFFGPIALFIQIVFLISSGYKIADITLSIISLVSKKVKLYIPAAILGIISALHDMLFFGVISAIFIAIQLDAYHDPNVLDPTKHDWFMVNSFVVLDIVFFLKMAILSLVAIFSIIRATKIMREIKNTAS